MVSADFQQIQQALRSAYIGDEVYEVRILTHVPGRTDSGYFNEATVAANTIVNTDGGGRQGTYSTLNPVNPALHARAYNVIMPGQRNLLTTDKDILYRHRLLVDLDAKRPSGISSTDAEKLLSYHKAVLLETTMMTLYGWPQPMFIDSGNGYHLIWMTERLDNSDLYTDLFKNTLKALAQRYDDEAVAIDKGNFNASRIVRIPGTVARKGSDIPERPHRVSSIIKPYDDLRVLTVSQMERIAQSAVEAQRSEIGAGRTPRSYPADEGAYRGLNSVSRASIDKWVPVLFEHINPRRLQGGGYRIESHQLGRNLQEDLSITADGGIKDFGVADMGDAREGHRTPVELVAEYRTGGDKKAAAEWLSDLVGVPLVDFDALLSGPVPPPEAQDISDLTGGVTTVEAFKVSSLYELEKTPLPLKRPLVSRLLGPGGTIMWAPPKSGKTYLALQTAICLCMGLPVLGEPIDAPIEVLYIALEDETGPMRERSNYIIQGLASVNNIVLTEEDIKAIHQRLHISAEDMYEDKPEVREQRPKGRRAFKSIQVELKKNPRIKLVVIDPFFLFKDEVQGRNDIVTEEYNNLIDVMRFFRHMDVNFLILHHTRKTKTGAYEDLDETVSGTNAITGVFANLIGLGRMGERGAASNAMAMSVKMRHVIDGTYNRWIRKMDDGSGFEEISAEENAMATQDELDLTLMHLTRVQVLGPKTITDISIMTRIGKDRLFHVLSRLVELNKIEQVGQGYCIKGIGPNLPRPGGRGRPPEHGARDVMREVAIEWVIKPVYTKSELCKEVRDRCALKGKQVPQATLDKYISDLMVDGTLTSVGSGRYQTTPIVTALPDVV